MQTWLTYTYHILPNQSLEVLPSFFKRTTCWLICFVNLKTINYYLIKFKYLSKKKNICQNNIWSYELSLWIIRNIGYTRRNKLTYCNLEDITFSSFMKILIIHRILENLILKFGRFSFHIAKVKGSVWKKSTSIKTYFTVITPRSVYFYYSFGIEKAL